MRILQAFIFTLSKGLECVNPGPAQTVTKAFLVDNLREVLIYDEMLGPVLAVMGETFMTPRPPSFLIKGCFRPRRFKGFLDMG